MTIESKYQYPVWREITVTFFDEYKLWCVTANSFDGDIETLDYCQHKSVAVDQAMIYAFDTAAGPARGEAVLIYTKDLKLQKRITKSN